MQMQQSFMLIFRDTTPEAYESMSRAQLQTCLDNWNGWVEGIATSGLLKHGHPLASSGRTVSKRRGETVLDGPFSEAKEAIGGYLLVTVKDIDEATEIASRCPNLQYGMNVEVRPVTEVCHLASALGYATMRG